MNFHRLASAFVCVIVLLMLPGCGTNTHEPKTLQTESVTLCLAPLGHALVDREGEWFDYSVCISNASMSAIWIPRIANLKVVSTYIIERNPEALCYEVRKPWDENLWMDAKHGLTSNHLEAEKIEPGQIKEFKAPVCITHATFKDVPRIRIALWVSNDKNLSNQTEVQSNEVPFPPKANP